MSKAHETILQCYEQFHKPEYLILDPLLIIRRYDGQEDLELISLIAALFAFGGVKQIQASLERVIQMLATQSITQTLLQAQNEVQLAKELHSKLKGFVHRIYIDRDVVMLLLLYRRSLIEKGSLKNHFLSHHDGSAETIEAGLTGIISDLKKHKENISFQAGPHFSHMLNSPAQKGTCKRWLMYLKWMVRPNDGIDLGLWAGNELLRPEQLLIPLDTHLFKISKRLRLTRRKTANWLTAVEVTRNLKRLDAADPTRFDFSICRLGMLEYRKLR